MSTIGQQLAALRKVVRHTCPECGAEFQGIVQAVYCSDRCRQAAKRARDARKIVKTPD